MPPQLYDRQTKDASSLAEVFYATPWGAIIGGANDEWLTTLYYMPSRDPGIWRLIVIGSNDEGRTWNEVGTISTGTHDPKVLPRDGNGPCEAGLVRLSGNDLYSVFRVESGHPGDPIRDMGEAWSSDDGKTWTKTVDTGFKGVAPHLRLLSNGILACTYGRPGPVTIMFSLDGGKKWTNVTPIFNGMSTRYTDLIEVRPGEVLVIYDAIPYGPDPIPATDRVSKNTIYATFVGVKKE
jgi:hypothetical protein